MWWAGLELHAFSLSLFLGPWRWAEHWGVLVWLNMSSVNRVNLSHRDSCPEGQE